MVTNYLYKVRNCLSKSRGLLSSQFARIKFHWNFCIYYTTLWEVDSHILELILWFLSKVRHRNDSLFTCEMLFNVSILTIATWESQDRWHVWWKLTLSSTISLLDVKDERHIPNHRGFPDWTMQPWKNVGHGDLFCLIQETIQPGIQETGWITNGEVFSRCGYFFFWSEAIE